MKPKILVHVCCAVCGAALIDWLKKDFEPAIFFYNPNIYPIEEYEKRKESAKKLTASFIEREYDNAGWLRAVRGLESEPEGGRRCEICFKIRLSKTAEEAKKQNINYFTSTLALSPYKNEKVVEKIGRATAGGVQFLSLAEMVIDKKDFWQKTLKIAKESNFYRQKYCGCCFSLTKK